MQTIQKYKFNAASTHKTIAFDLNQNNKNHDKENKESTESTSNYQQIECKGTFGNDLFSDPSYAIPDAAVLSVST